MSETAVIESPPTVADTLRQAMRGLAKSVTLISTVDKTGQRHVMAATAVTPVSMAPPSMLFCINRDASSYPTLLDGAEFCINVLTADHVNLAHLCSFGAKGEARFDSGQWSQDENGVPYLSDSQSAIICIQDHRIPYDSHDIFIGLVRDVYFGKEIDPLIYADGEYKELSDNVLVP